MRAFILSLAVLMINTVAFGQAEIDGLINQKKEIDSSKVYLMHDYRLPDWGYDNLYLDISGNWEGSDRSGNNKTTQESYKSIQLSPAYRYFIESEDNQFDFESAFYSSLRNNTRETDLPSSYSKSDQTQGDVIFQTSGGWHRYLNNQWFLKLYTKDSFRYYEQQNETTNTLRETSESGYINREYQVSLRLGPGYGRVRKITPVIRALRFNERMKDLSLGSGISDEDLKELAAFFTKRESYLSSYDRSNKYLYHQFPQGVLSQLDNLSPWGVMYLHDTWSEVIGERLEGFEISGGMSINYEKKDHSGNAYSSSDMELMQLGLYFEQAYYHNPSYTYQFGITSRALLSKVMNDESAYESIGSLSLTYLNLWNVMDKLLMNWNLGYQTDFFSGDLWERVDCLKSNLSFQYFIENNLSFDTQLSYKYFYNWPEEVWINVKDYYHVSDYQKEHEWRIVFNLRYYLKRGIF